MLEDRCSYSRMASLLWPVGDVPQGMQLVFRVIIEQRKEGMLMRLLTR